MNPNFWEIFDEQLQEATRAALGYYNVQEKPQVPASRLAMLSFDTIRPALVEMGDRFGWTPDSWFRKPDDRTTVLVVRRKTCGHRMWFVLSDEDLMGSAEAGAGRLVDFLWCAFDAGPMTGCACFEDIELPEAEGK